MESAGKTSHIRLAQTNILVDVKGSSLKSAGFEYVAHMLTGTDLLHCRMDHHPLADVLKGKRFNWNGEKRLSENPFDGFGRYDDKADCRRKRRALTEAELSRLLVVAAERPLNDAMTIRKGPNKGKLTAKVKPENVVKLKRLGRERALFYKTLILTGLRKNELASISIGQCHLDGDRPYIDLNAGDEKNGQGNDIPLRADLAAELKAWIADMDSDPSDILQLPGHQESGYSGYSLSAKLRKLFVLNTDGLVRILDRDLKAAGIPKTDERGYSVDVHALRHSFGTLLSTSGVAPRIAQAAMRHSDLRLTMNVYTDPKLLDIHSALDSLPSLDRPVELAQATGTDDDRLVPPNVPPSHSRNRSIQDDSGGLGELTSDAEKQEKPREKTVFPGAFDSRADWI